jgi:transcriptional regulator
MALYTPRHFAVADPHAAVALMQAHSFATLVTADAGEPQVTHLPLLWSPGGEFGVLEGHIARANPHWQRFDGGHTLAIFHGPHAYVSPSWYAQPDREVPTWNYAAVHAHGRVELIEDRDARLALLDRSVARFESGKTPPWTRSVDGERLEALLRSIVGFRITITRLDAKFKMNQNKTAADRAGVIAALDADAASEVRAVADWMRRHD